MIGSSPKITLSPFFHISVTMVSPGYRTPANRTLISLKAPNFLKMCLPEIPNEQRPYSMKERNVRRCLNARSRESSAYVEDRLFETTNGSKVGINVKRVVISRKTVDGSLLRKSLLLYDSIGLAGRSLVDSGSRSTICGRNEKKIRSRRRLRGNEHDAHRFQSSFLQIHQHLE
jgi:hypothetical protein